MTSHDPSRTPGPRSPRRSTSPRAVISRHAYTLIELVISMSSAAFLLVGLGSAVMLTAKGFRPETSQQHSRSTAAFTQRDVLADLQLATGFTERTDKAVTFFVPDRDGDGHPESLRYSWSGVSGAPLLLSYNGATAVAVVNDVRSLSFTYLTKSVTATQLPSEQTGSPVILWVNNSQSPTSNELSWRSLIESWGFSVSMLGVNDSLASGQAALTTAKAIIISGDLDDTSFSQAKEVAALSIGIVNLHPDLVDEFGFCAAATTQYGSTISLTNITHHITKTHTLGTKSVGVLLGTTLARLSDSPSTDLFELGTASGTKALVALDPGKKLHNGDVAAGRRVMLPWGQGLDPAYLSGDAKTLTARSIEWATGVGDPCTQDLKSLGYTTVFTERTDGLSNRQVATSTTLADKAKVRSISAYLGGDANYTRFAIYSDAGGKPGALLVTSDPGQTTTAYKWVTLTVPETILEPGTYWLTLFLDSSNQKFYLDSSVKTSTWAVAKNDAEANGYLSTWGTPESTSTGAISIYATYEVQK